MPARNFGMARQSTGMAVAAGAVIEARVTNKQSVVVHAMANGSANDVYLDLPTDGAWASVTSKADSAVFFRLQDSKSWSAAPQVEWKITGTVYEMPSFVEGDDHAAFVAKWNETQSPFAVAENSVASLLLPAVDREAIATMSTWSDFKDLNGTLQFYTSLFASYEQWLGADGSTPEHVSGNHRLFARADLNGAGAGQYRWNAWISISGNSIKGYIGSKNGWLTLHEVGHGYDGLWWHSRGAGDISLAEVWNNVYGYHYQSVVNNNPQWLYGNGKDPVRTEIEAARPKWIAGTPNQNLRHTLDLVVRMIEKTGLDGFSHLNQEIRTQRAAGVDVDSMRRVDLLNMYLGADNGFNFTAWLEFNGFTLDADKRRHVMDEKPATLPVQLSELVSASELDAAVAALGADSKYGLVTPHEVAPLGLTGTAKVTATNVASAAVEGRQVSLWDGTTKVASAPLVNGVASFDELPIGAYTVRMPYSSSNDLPTTQWIAVGTAGAELAVAYSQAKATTTGSSEFSLRGIGNYQYANVKYRHDQGTLQVAVDTNSTPHSYFSGLYMAITVTAPNGQVLADHQLIGAAKPTDAGAVHQAPVGTKVTITHMEPDRAVPISATTGKPIEEWKVTTKSPVSYVVTPHGLAPVGAEASAVDRYAAELKLQGQALLAKAQANPDGYYAEQAAVLIAQVNTLPQDKQIEALFSYAMGLDFLLQASRR